MAIAVLSGAKGGSGVGQVEAEGNKDAFGFPTEAPAGLTVMISAAVNGKLIMMTDTPVTRGYINDEFGVLLQNNVEDWTCAIRDCFEKRDEMQKKAERLSLFLKTECTEDKFVSILKGIIDQI